MDNLTTLTTIATPASPASIANDAARPTHVLDLLTKSASLFDNTTHSTVATPSFADYLAEVQENHRLTALLLDCHARAAESAKATRWWYWLAIVLAGVLIGLLSNMRWYPSSVADQGEEARGPEDRGIQLRPLPIRERAAEGEAGSQPGDSDGSDGGTAYHDSRPN